MTAAGISAAFGYARGYYAALRGRIRLRLNRLYARAVASNAIQLTGLIELKHSHGNIVGLIGHSGGP